MDILTGWDTASSTGDWIFSPDHPMIWTDEHGNPVLDDAGGLVDAIVDPALTLQRSSDLATAVLISLFSDAQADSDDALPDAAAGRRGWWGGAIGSKLWLRQRAKPTPALLVQVKDDIQQALAWLVDDGVAASVDVATEFTRPGMLGARITIHRGAGPSLSLRFANLWDAL